MAIRICVGGQCFPSRLGLPESIPEIIARARTIFSSDTSLGATHDHAMNLQVFLIEDIKSEGLGRRRWKHYDCLHTLRPRSALAVGVAGADLVEVVPAISHDRSGCSSWPSRSVADGAPAGGRYCPMPTDHSWRRSSAASHVSVTWPVSRRSLLTSCGAARSPTSSVSVQFGRKIEAVQACSTSRIRRLVRSAPEGRQNWLPVRLSHLRLASALKSVTGPDNWLSLTISPVSNRGSVPLSWLESPRSQPRQLGEGAHIGNRPGQLVGAGGPATSSSVRSPRSWNRLRSSWLESEKSTSSALVKSVQVRNRPCPTG